MTSEVSASAFVRDTPRAATVPNFDAAEMQFEGIHYQCITDSQRGGRGAEGGDERVGQLQRLR